MSFQKSTAENSPKVFRNRRFFVSVIAAIFVVFAVVLALSVTTSYLSNKKAYSEALHTRAEYQMNNISNNIHAHGTQTVYLRNNAQIIQLLSSRALGNEQQLLLEKNIAEDIWNSIGQFDFFIGAALEGRDGSFYLKSTKLADFSAQVKEIVNPQRLNFAENKYDITLATYDNESIVVITSPVIDTDNRLCGYLHIFLNHLVYDLPNTANQEDFLFAADTYQVVDCNGFINANACAERVQQSQGLQEQIQTAQNPHNDLITYTNAGGQKMIGALQHSADFISLTAIQEAEMLQSIIPFTLLQIVISLLLIAMLALLVYLLFNRTTRPVTEMIEQCSRLANGEDAIDIGTSQDSDLDQLGKAFNSYRKKLENAVYSDPLLGIGTRYKYIRDIDLLIAAGQLQNFSIFIVDIKEFSKYNDVFSLAIGDNLLREIAARLSSLFSNLYRINGDVFLGMSAQTDTQEQAATAERIHRLVSQKIRLGSGEFELQCRISICAYPQNGNSATALLEKAQSALHQTKKIKLSDTVFYNDEMVENLRRENEILTLLLRRIADQTLEVWYQPIYDLKSQQFKSAEALLRLKDDAGNYLSPYEVILIAEKNNMVDLVGNYVLTSSCQLLKKLEQLANCDLEYIQVNLSVQELARNNYASQALALIRALDVHPSSIGMEVTETMVIQSFGGAIETLNELRSSGVRIAMDDFGSGYSGINYLSHLPFDILKLDKELIAQVNESAEQCAFIKTIVQMAKIKNLITVAEGVEDTETLANVVSCEVDSIQGYYFSKPLCEELFIEFMAKDVDK